MEASAIKRFSDGFGSAIGVIVAASAMIGFIGMSAHLALVDVSLGLWPFTRRKIAPDGIAEVLLLPSEPILQTSPFGRARRFSFWFLALFFHTVNALLYVLKTEADLWCLLMKGLGSVITLAVCMGLLVLLGQSFTITKDFWISGGTFGSLYVLTVMITMIASQSCVVLELIHVLITLLMNIFRFSCQWRDLYLLEQEGLLQFQKLPFSVAILGIFGACLPFIPDLSISAYKIASLIGLVFRFLDVSFILGVGRDKINRFLVSLQEFLI
ncbi:hypothetical protein ACP70R_036686 [Stipagrostis hirtigluma subsp. patula]